jgi:hypothetical protein
VHCRLDTLAHLAVDCDRDDAVRDPELKLPVSVRQGTVACLRSPVRVPTTYSEYQYIVIRLLLYPSKPTSYTRRRPLKYSAVPESTASTEAATPAGYCGYSQPTPCATARRISGAEPPDGSRGARVLERVEGAAVRGYSRGYSAVRTHRDVREGRADDADMAAATVVDTHEAAAAAQANGLHTARRAKLAAAPAPRVRRRYPTAL